MLKSGVETLQNRGASLQKRLRSLRRRLVLLLAVIGPGSSEIVTYFGWIMSESARARHLTRSIRRFPGAEVPGT